HASPDVADSTGVAARVSRIGRASRGAGAARGAWHRSCSTDTRVRRRCAVRLETVSGEAMRVMVHNGARRPLDADAHPTVGAVVDALLGAGADAHALVSIAVDGCGVDLDELGELRALPCAGVGELVVETRPLRAVASDALESASQYG